MQYIALLYGAEGEETDPTSEAFAQDLKRYERFGEIAGDAIVGGEALAPSSEAVTIRHRPDGPVVTDGPHSESAEVIGGLYVLEADDLDEALELARQIPAAEDGAVEVRPSFEWSQRHPSLTGGARRWLALLAGEETDADRPGTDAWDAAIREHDRFGAEFGDAIVGGAALHPSDTATTVRVRDGRTLLTEGPYPEANEVVGGLYLLLARDRKEAVGIAARIPMGGSGLVEVRPVLEFGD